MDSQIRQQDISMHHGEDARPPFPPFTWYSAEQKVRVAEDGWNRRDQNRIVLACTPECRWRNRSEILIGRAAIAEFLQRKWEQELEYRVIAELWAYDGDCIASRFVYEWKNLDGRWFRAHGNENRKFNDDGLIIERHSSINDIEIDESDRKFLWTPGRRPDNHPGLAQLGL